MNDLKLNYKIKGSGPPLIIVHGLYGCLDNWITVASYFESLFTTIVLDLRGHGRSESDGELTYSGMVNDIHLLLLRLNIKNLSIIGHSMGGKIAMLLKAIYPDLVEKLIIIDIFPKDYTNSNIFTNHKKIISSLLETNLDGDRENIQLQLEKSLNDPLLAKFMVKNIKRRRRKMIWKLDLDAIKEGLAQICSSVKIDDLAKLTDLKSWDIYFIRGDGSNYILDSDIDRSKQIFNNPKIYTVSNSSHWLHYDNPQKLIEIISGILNLNDQIVEPYS